MHLVCFYCEGEANRQQIEHEPSFSLLFYSDWLTPAEKVIPSGAFNNQSSPLSLLRKGLWCSLCLCSADPVELILISPCFLAGLHVMVWGWNRVVLAAAAALEADEAAPSAGQDAHSFSRCQQVLLPALPGFLRPPAPAHPCPSALYAPSWPASASTTSKTGTAQLVAPCRVSSRIWLRTRKGLGHKAEKGGIYRGWSHQERKTWFKERNRLQNRCSYQRKERWTFRPKDLGPVGVKRHFYCSKNYKEVPQVQSGAADSDLGFQSSRAGELSGRSFPLQTF